MDYNFSSGVTMKFVGVPNGGNSGQATGEPFLHGEEWTQRYRRIDSHGTAFEGADGWVHVDRNRINLQPDTLLKTDFESLTTKLIRSTSQLR